MHSNLRWKTKTRQTITRKQQNIIDKSVFISACNVVYCVQYVIVSTIGRWKRLCECLSVWLAPHFARCAVHFALCCWVRAIVMPPNANAISHLFRAFSRQTQKFYCHSIHEANHINRSNVNRIDSDESNCTHKNRYLHMRNVFFFYCLACERWQKEEIVHESAFCLLFTVVWRFFGEGGDWSAQWSLKVSPYTGNIFLFVMEWQPPGSGESQLISIKSLIFHWQEKYFFYISLRNGTWNEIGPKHPIWSWDSQHASESECWSFVKIWRKKTLAS